ncbi:gluconate 2-dehydrogenase subunit 3 family protein [Pseudomonas sp. GD03842]|uniref:gluconate 2-dehydrogenase subunit 3 family protein n=1 Tax=unclassified Pseudomonas TaxID=196821 RepID=UPI000D36A4B9|nr:MULTISPECIES: gluconate 2-dehydrogenase subunit 3 family protein [unclassified Pseudomonas]MDH0746861.1 gluconate 2-dehydrogenase subunit 3 family protein [Pseudomonas sp. GD03842]RAU43891.1 gluconate 2-dehydrogenase subunit 3 family protein [Pseudomonas sp. RIT 409]RAU56215.1 gluconate 2-dehydrogenase subunit 3 family protein [Pseudomonas sp. RIT 412]
MSDTPNSRREFLRRSAILIPAVSLGGYSATQIVAPAPVQAAAAADEPAHAPKAYEPSFFTAAEWQFVNAACAVIIPEDEEGPGAVSAGVPEFLDRQMETPYAYGRLWYMQGPFITDQPVELGFQYKLVPREMYRLGIAEVDAVCQTAHGKHFAELPEQVRVATLTALEKGQLKLNNVPGEMFFALLLKNVKEGYFADPKYGGNQDMAGWKMIGFPGARADFMDWVDRPNERYPLGPVSINGLKG